MLIVNWREFCDAHISDREIDPLYEFAVKAIADKGPGWGNRFVLHLLTFYDVGGAVQAADLTNEHTFWDYVISNYDDFPRGTNRRHSRGDLGRQYVINCEKVGPPNIFLAKAWASNYTDLVKVMQTTFHGCGYGAYFVWKIMDYQDRVLGRPVQLLIFEAVKHMPDEAKKGAKLLWPNRTLDDVLLGVTKHIWKYDAPGLATRRCGFPEAESLLCALRGWYNGTYEHGQDLRERHEQLRGRPDYLRFLPPAPAKDKYERPNPLDPQALSAHLP